MAYKQGHQRLFVQSLLTPLVNQCLKMQQG